MTKHNERLTKKINMLENIDRKDSFPAEDLLKLLPIEKTDNILDLGAGTGYLALPAAKQTDGIVYALDLDGGILEYLDSKAKKEKLMNLKTVEASFNDIPLEDNSVEIALASISLHEITPLSGALEEIFRVMTKNGYFLCVELEKKEVSRGPRVHSSVMEQALRDAGFDIQEKLFPSAKVANEDAYIIIAKK